MDADDEEDHGGRAGAGVWAGSVTRMGQSAITARQRQSRTRAFDMSYDSAKKESSFCDVVAETLCNTTYRRMVCLGCKRNQLINLHTVVEEPPSLLVLKVGLGDKVSEVAEDLWRQPDWVKESLRVVTDPAKHSVQVTAPDPEAAVLEEAPGKLFKLHAIIERVTQRVAGSQAICLRAKRK